MSTYSNAWGKIHTIMVSSLAVNLIGIIYSRTCNKPPSRATGVHLSIFTWRKKLDIFKGHFNHLWQFTADRAKTLPQTHSYTSWFDFFLPPTAPSQKCCWWVAAPDFPWYKTRLIFHGAEKPNLSRETMFPPTASPFPLTMSRAHFRSTRYLPVLCWVSFFAQFLISHLLRELQKHTKAAAAPLLLWTCSSVSNCCLRRCPEVAGEWCSLRPPQHPKENASPLEWLPPYGMLSALFF